MNPNPSAARRSVLSEHRALAALGIPIAATQLAQVALTTTDTLMMGLLGTQALAAGGLAIVLFNQLRTMGVGLITAVGNQVATAAAHGEAAADDAGTTAQIRDLVRAAFLLATVGGVVGALLLIGAGRLLTSVGQDPAVVALAQPLLVALAPGLVPCLWFQAIRQFTVGMRRPKALAWITVGSIGVNAALNWGFIHGTGGLPKLGLAGIGLATTVVYVLSFAVFYGVTRRDPTLAPMLSAQVWRARPDTVRRLVRLGVPIAATYGSEAGFFSVLALIMGSFGAAALAAHTVVNQLIYITFQVTIGLSHAASITVSREVALGRLDAAARVARTALGQGAVIMSVVAAGYLAVPGIVLRPFLDPGTAAGAAAAAVATTLLLVATAVQYVDCAQNIGVGLLRGLDDTAASFRMTLIGYWIVGLPTAWLLSHGLGLGATGGWLGLLTGLSATAALLLRRFHRSITTRVRTATAPAAS